MSETVPNTDFRPTADWEHLRLRAALLRRLREFFDSRGFLEVETPILSADTVVDRHLDPFYTEAGGGGRGRVVGGRYPVASAKPQAADLQVSRPPFPAPHLPSPVPRPPSPVYGCKPRPSSP